MDVDVDDENIENGVEIATQTEIESDVPKISIPIKRCTKSYRYRILVLFDFQYK